MTTLIKHQTKQFRKDYTRDRRPETIIATVRHDDSCGNGHNTFSITGDVFTTTGNRSEPSVVHGNRTLYLDCGGCIHDQIAEHFPELAPLIKWHLTSTDGPMHYVANTIHHASDQDYWGRRAGEPSRFEYGVRFADSPVTHMVPEKFWKFIRERHGSGTFQVVEIAHDREPDKFGPHYTFVGFGDKWHECPFRSKIQADEFAEGMNRCKVEFVSLPVEFSKGKPRDLDAARNAAVWPDATDNELTAPDLAERLRDRLPALLEEFRAAVESLGFAY